MSEEKTVITACQGWGCHEHCMLRTHVEDGVITRTERAVFPGPRPDRNCACQKGMVVGKLPYIKERVLYPMKRVGERGEGKFERISWDQAIEEITAKLTDIREKYGPEAIMVNTFCCGNCGGPTALTTLLSQRLIITSGCTRFHFPIIDVAGQWAYNIDEGNPGNVLISDTDSMYRSKYILNWSGNPIGWTRAAHTTRTMLDAQENGAKIVHIGLVYDSTAAKADQFIPINPSTDGALALAMAKIIVDEGTYDEAALVKYTCAPLLVRDDNGLYLRESDIKEGGSDKAFLCWDKKTNSVQVIGPVGGSGNYAEGVAKGGTTLLNPNAGAVAVDNSQLDPELEKVVTVGGVACKTVFVKLREHLAPWTPEKQEEITGVPAQVMIDLVHEYMSVSPATICLNDGMRYSNGGQAYRAINLLPMLSGNFAKVGGRVIFSALGDGPAVSLNEMAFMAPEGFAGMKGNFTHFDKILESFDHPERQQFRAYINTYTNPVHAWPRPQVFCEQFLKKLDLIVALEFRYTDTTDWADYVLPECTPFEHEEIYTNSDCLVLQQPAIEPMGEARTSSEVYAILANAMGVGEYFADMTDEDWTRLRLASGDPHLEGITYERLQEEQVIPLTGATGETDIYSKSEWQYDTVTGRQEMYSEDLASVGGSFGGYFPSHLHDDPELRKKYPLQFYPGRHRVFMQTQFVEFEELRAIGGDKPCATLNPETAKEYGIKKGDLIEIFNDHGSMKAYAAMSEAFPPGMCHVWYAYRKRDHVDQVPPTVLSYTLCGEEAHTEVADCWEERNQVKSKALGIPEVLLFHGLDRVETYWEDCCQVRKIEEA